MVCLLTPAQAIDYTFEQILNGTGQFNHIYGPSLNDAGAMAFTAIALDGSYRAYAIDEDRTLLPMSSTAGGNVEVMSASINNDNTLVFRQGPFIYRSFLFGELIPYQETDLLPGGIQSLQHPWIGDTDAVVYVASHRPPPDPHGETVLYRGEGRVIGGPAATTSFQWPDINGLEDIVAAGSDGLYLNNAIVYQHSGSSAAINDAGTIAFFSANYGTMGIYTGDGLSTPTLYAAATGGTMMGHPDINNDGMIAYMDRASGVETVFAGPGHQRVLGATMQLFASSVAETWFFRGLNNLGQIAFAYRLVNGQRGIALASPRNPSALANGTFNNGMNLFSVDYGISDGNALVTNVAGDPRLQMSTGIGVLGLLQDIDTSSGDPYQLEFDFDWLTAAGSLQVQVNDELVLTVGADGSASSPVGVPAVQTVGDLSHLSLVFAPAAIGNPLDGYIRFELHPGSLATLQMDNIIFRATPLSSTPEPGLSVLRLAPNRPNPFNPSTAFAYDVPEAGPVRLQVFDLRGRLVRTLVEESLPAGHHEAQWDGRDGEGRAMPSAVYLSRLQAGAGVTMGEMTLVR